MQHAVMFVSISKEKDKTPKDSLRLDVLVPEGENA